MPRLTRFFLKAALIWLFLALLSSFLTSFSCCQVLFPAAIHFFVVGWLAQAVFGVTFWMFPRAASKDSQRTQLNWWLLLAFWNGGLFLRGIAEPFVSLSDRQRWLPWALLFSALLQWLGGVLFIQEAWGRIREKPVRTTAKGS